MAYQKQSRVEPPLFRRIRPRLFCITYFSVSSERYVRTSTTAERIAVSTSAAGMEYQVHPEAAPGKERVVDGLVLRAEEQHHLIGQQLHHKQRNQPDNCHAKMADENQQRVKHEVRQRGMRLIFSRPSQGFR